MINEEATLDSESLSESALFSGAFVVIHFSVLLTDKFHP